MTSSTYEPSKSTKEEGHSPKSSSIFNNSSKDQTYSPKSSVEPQSKITYSPTQTYSPKSASKVPDSISYTPTPITPSKSSPPFYTPSNPSPCVVNETVVECEGSDESDYESPGQFYILQWHPLRVERGSGFNSRPQCVYVDRRNCHNFM